MCVKHLLYFHLDYSCLLLIWGKGFPYIPISHLLCEQGKLSYTCRDQGNSFKSPVPRIKLGSSGLVAKLLPPYQCTLQIFCLSVQSPP